jgi:hypothetical protein
LMILKNFFSYLLTSQRFLSGFYDI